MPDKINLDYETASEVDLIASGLDRYRTHPSTRVLMVAYSINNGPVQQYDMTYGGKAPAEFWEALRDPEVIKSAFNAQFERVVTRDVLGIETPNEMWRCSMVLAYQLGFAGNLDNVGRAMRLPEDQQKLKRGKALIKQFSMPQRVTKRQPHRWRDALTDPDDWAEFNEYNAGDVVTELAVEKRLIKYPVLPNEWDMYALDQEINDNGLPIDRRFVINAIEMADKRKSEILAEMQDFTGLRNPGSVQQLLPYVQDRGYPFDDLQKDSVKKAIREAADNGMDPEAVTALNMRLTYNKSSIAKYNTIINRINPDNRFRFAFQFCGASRTKRWAGRSIQPQNLPRTPKAIEKLDKLTTATELIRANDYDMVHLYAGEPMETLSGLIRSAIRAPDGKKLVVCDLSSIETAVIAWLAKCVRLLKVFGDKKDPYVDFATSMYKLPYEEIAAGIAAEDSLFKGMRTNAKPAVLGAGYRLGGGDIKADGKKTGLWGYAENMGVMMTRDEAHLAVRTYRDNFTEVCDLWVAYENAVKRCLGTGRPVDCGFVRFEHVKPFLVVTLPSGGKLYYYRPQIKRKVMKSAMEDGEDWVVEGLHYEGKSQSRPWTELDSHGGKLVENFVQAIARDLLKAGLRRARRENFFIVGHVHDEIICEQDEDDDYHNHQLLRQCMIEPLRWAEGCPLNAAGWEGKIYRKD